MWSVRSEPVEVSLSMRRWGVRAPGDAATQWSEVASIEDALHALEGALTELARASARSLPVRVWLGTALARPLIVPADSGARGVDDVEALARALARTECGFEGPVRVWCDRLTAGQNVVCAVVAEARLEALAHCVAAAAAGAAGPRATASLRRAAWPWRGRLRLVSVRPWWNLVLDATLADARRTGRRVGWTFADDDGLVQGLVDGVRCEQLAFADVAATPERRAAQRLRTQVGWGAVDAVEHLGLAYRDHVDRRHWPLAATRALDALAPGEGAA